MTVGVEPQPRFDFWGEELRRASEGRRARVGRPRRAWPALVVIALVCGTAAALAVHFVGGGAGGRTTAAAPLGATPQAVANAVNLHPADLPGFRVANGGGATASGDPSAQFARCFGSSAVAGGGAADHSSPDFVSGVGLQTVSLQSSVAVVSASQLAGDTALAGNRRFPQCYATALAAVDWSTGGTTITASDPVGTRLPAPVAAGDAVRPIVAARAGLTWTADGLPIPVYVDVYAVAVGHDEISLMVFSAGRPYSTGDEQRLIALLVARALAQPH